MRYKAATVLCVVAIALSGATLGGALLAKAETNKGNEAPVVKIVARRFSYTPNEIVLKKRQAVVLEFTSIDFVHGFKIPDLNIRADLPPGIVTRLQLTPDRSGVYDFLCDNFCGAKHEEMNGRIIVKD